MESRAIKYLPSNSSSFSPSLIRFLSTTFKSKSDLFKSEQLVHDLRSDCLNLNASISDLSRRLADSIVEYGSYSDQVKDCIADVKNGLGDLKCKISGVGSGQILAEDLPALAKEVARVETVRAYAETALKLDGLVGDVEDAVSSSVATKLKSHTNSIASEESCQISINSLKQIEDILTSISKSRQQWSSLISVVDHRVDRALAILRPQAILDHRSLLSSLGWPPSLSSSSFVNQSTMDKQSKITNPLLTMDGELKRKYFVSFLSLCRLQELQNNRKLRQLEGYKFAKTSIRQPLWAIEELVTPIFLVSQRHFLKWIDKPELIFALVYKLMREFIDSMDEVLQPLVDKARLVGYSCREEWISSMVSSLCTLLAKDILPKYVDIFENDSRTSFLHLVDQMISFDKRTLALISNSGMLLSLKEDENLPRISVLSVFCDRPDWLDIWAEIELSEVSEKLKLATQTEKSWNTRLQGTVLMTGMEDYKSPLVSGYLFQCLSNIIERSRPIPNIVLRKCFIRLTAAPLIREFFDYILRRCQEAEGLTALADDNALINVSKSINAVRYCESVLLEWLDDLYFLEMESDEKTVFEEEIGGLRDFRTEWAGKLSNVILRGFEAHCREYFKNKKQWLEKGENGWVISKDFVGALDYLQAKLSKLEENLNNIDFVTLWRNIASGVDGLIFFGVLMGGGKFNNGSVEKFSRDLDVLFAVFKNWCLRPEGFFPKLNAALKLLKMEKHEVQEFVREKVLRNLSSIEVEKIVKIRVFSV